MSKKRKPSQKPSRKPQKLLSPDQFANELKKVIDGDPRADNTVKYFWESTSRATGVRAAVIHPQCIEVLRQNRNGEEKDDDR